MGARKFGIALRTAYHSKASLFEETPGRFDCQNPVGGRRAVELAGGGPQHLPGGRGLEVLKEKMARKGNFEDLRRDLVKRNT